MLADIYEAYRLLVDTFDLEVSDYQLFVAEQMMKARIVARTQGAPAKSVAELGAIEIFGNAQSRRTANDPKLQVFIAQYEKDLREGRLKSPL